MEEVKEGDADYVVSVDLVYTFPKIRRRFPRLLVVGGILEAAIIF